jgi:hypothetical protein
MEYNFAITSDNFAKFVFTLNKPYIYSTHPDNLVPIRRSSMHGKVYQNSELFNINMSPLLILRLVSIWAICQNDARADTTNGRVSDKPRRLPRHQCAQAHNSKHSRRQLSFMYWLCGKQNCLLCAYEHDFGNNYIITLFRQVLRQTRRCPYRAFGPHLRVQWIGRLVVSQMC